MSLDRSDIRCIVFDGMFENTIWGRFDLAITNGDLGIILLGVNDLGAIKGLSRIILYGDLGTSCFRNILHSAVFIQILFGLVRLISFFFFPTDI